LYRCWQNYGKIGADLIFATYNCFICRLHLKPTAQGFAKVKSGKVETFPLVRGCFF